MPAVYDITDGYPIFEKAEWEPKPNAEAGALILKYKIQKNNKPYWVCFCRSCGSTCEKRQDNLRYGAIGGQILSSGRLQKGTRSCGCLQNKNFKKPNKIGIIETNFINQVYENWKVVKDSPIRDNNGSILYLCQDTNTELYTLISARHFKFGHKNYLRDLKTISEEINKNQIAPHGLSKNEKRILNLLKENNIKGIYQCTFSECKSIHKLPFDFFIENKYIIEYDGEQHFNPISAWGGENFLNVIRAHDLLKNKYCFEHNIPIIRIPYDTEYDLNDLKLETTRFLLTPENEEDYYRR